VHLVDLERPTTGAGIFTLYAIGDTHADRREYDEDRFARYIAHICDDPLSVAVFVGDALDGRIPGRKHFDADTVRLDFLGNLKSYVNHGLDVCERMFKPLIKAKVPLVMVSGNHDEYLEEIGFTAALCQRLGPAARYLGGEGFIRLRTGRYNKKSGGGMYVTKIYATPGPKVNAMQRTYEWIEADVVMAGHVHDGDIRVIPSYTVQSSGDLKLVESPRVMYRAPSFVKRAIAGVVGYQGKKGYPASDDGLQYIRVDPYARRVRRIECDF
jgi:predicted MPP superfamily phosphohydrolase